MKTFNRLVALLLAPCLIGDPACAFSAGAGHGGRPLRFLFTSQALAEQVLTMGHVVIGEAARIREMRRAGAKVAPDPDFQSLSSEMPEEESGLWLPHLVISVTDMDAEDVKVRMKRRGEAEKPANLYQALPLSVMSLIATLPFGARQVSIPHEGELERGFFIRRDKPAIDLGFIIHYVFDESTQLYTGSGVYYREKPGAKERYVPMETFYSFATDYVREHFGEIERVPGRFRHYAPSWPGWRTVVGDGGYASAAADEGSGLITDALIQDSRVGRLPQGKINTAPAGLLYRIPVYRSSLSPHVQVDAFASVEVTLDPSPGPHSQWMSFTEYRSYRARRSRRPAAIQTDFENWLAQTARAWGYSTWVFSPGMLFDNLREWWGKFYRRLTNHEGFDLAKGIDASGQIADTWEGLPVYAVADGEAVFCYSDFMARSVVVRYPHIVNDFGDAFHSIYVHFKPEPELAALLDANKQAQGITIPVKKGQVLGFIGKDPGKTSAVPIHLHYSEAWIPPDISWATLNPAAAWDKINPNFSQVFLVDPFEHIHGIRRVVARPNDIELEVRPWDSTPTDQRLQERRPLPASAPAPAAPPPARGPGTASDPALGLSIRPAGVAEPAEPGVLGRLTQLRRGPLWEHEGTIADLAVTFVAAFFLLKAGAGTALAEALFGAGAVIAAVWSADPLKNLRSALRDGVIPLAHYYMDELLTAKPSDETIFDSLQAEPVKTVDKSLMGTFLVESVEPDAGRILRVDRVDGDGTVVARTGMKWTRSGSDETFEPGKEEVLYPPGALADPTVRLLYDPWASHKGFRLVPRAPKGTPILAFKATPGNSVLLNILGLLAPPGTRWKEGTRSRPGICAVLGDGESRLEIATTAYGWRMRLPYDPETGGGHRELHYDRSTGVFRVDDHNGNSESRSMKDPYRAMGHERGKKMVILFSPEEFEFIARQMGYRLQGKSGDIEWEIRIDPSGNSDPFPGSRSRNLTVLGVRSGPSREDPPGVARIGPAARKASAIFIGAALLAIGAFFGYAGTLRNAVLSAATLGTVMIPAMAVIWSEADPVAWAQRLMRRNDYENAWSFLQAALERLPKDPILLGLSAITAAKREDYTEAVDLAVAGIEIVPHKQQAWGVLAYVLYMAKAVEEALVISAEEIMRDPHRAQSFRFRANLFVTRWDTRHKSPELDHSLDLAHAVTNSLTEIHIHPEDGGAHGYLSWLYEKQGKLDESIVEREKEVDLQPENSSARERLFRLYFAQIRTLLETKTFRPAQILIKHAARRLGPYELTRLRWLMAGRSWIGRWPVLIPRIYVPAQLFFIRRGWPETGRFFGHVVLPLAIESGLVVAAAWLWAYAAAAHPPDAAALAWRLRVLLAGWGLLHAWDPRDHGRPWSWAREGMLGALVIGICTVGVWRMLAASSAGTSASLLWAVPAVHGVVNLLDFIFNGPHMQNGFRVYGALGKNWETQARRSYKPGDEPEDVAPDGDELSDLPSAGDLSGLLSPSRVRGRLYEVGLSGGRRMHVLVDRSGGAIDAEEQIFMSGMHRSQAPLKIYVGNDSLADAEDMAGNASLPLPDADDGFANLFEHRVGQARQEVAAVFGLRMILKAVPVFTGTRGANVRDEDQRQKIRRAALQVTQERLHGTSAEEIERAVERLLNLPPAARIRQVRAVLTAVTNYTNALIAQFIGDILRDNLDAELWIRIQSEHLLALATLQNHNVLDVALVDLRQALSPPSVAEVITQVEQIWRPAKEVKKASSDPAAAWKDFRRRLWQAWPADTMEPFRSLEEPALQELAQVLMQFIRFTAATIPGMMANRMRFLGLIIPLLAGWVRDHPEYGKLPWSMLPLNIQWTLLGIRAVRETFWPRLGEIFTGPLFNLTQSRPNPPGGPGGSA